MKASAYVKIDGGIDLDYSEVAASKDYLITTEHGASSYGQPVVVDRKTGEAFGPAEFRDEIVVVGSELQDGLTRWEIADALMKAGYNARGM